MSMNSSDDKEKLPPAPVERRKPDKVQRFSISMTKEEAEKLKKLVGMKRGGKKSISGLIRLALENQDYLESIKRQGGKITVKTPDGEEYDFDPIE